MVGVIVGVIVGASGVGVMKASGASGGDVRMGVGDVLQVVSLRCPL